MKVMSQHYVLNADEGESLWFLGTLATIKASSSQTGGVMSLVEFLHPAGFATPLHVHHHEDEAFYILEGAIRGILGDQPWYAGPGTFVWLPRGIPHGYTVVGEEPARTLVIAVPSGFDQFVAEAGDPAPERILPTPAAPDIERLTGAAKRAGQEILGPLVLP